MIMGLFDGIMNELTARKAYKAHVTGNQLSDKGEVASHIFMLILLPRPPVRGFTDCSSANLPAVRPRIYRRRVPNHGKSTKIIPFLQYSCFKCFVLNGFLGCHQRMF